MTEPPEPADDSIAGSAENEAPGSDGVETTAVIQTTLTESAVQPNSEDETVTSSSTEDVGATPDRDDIDPEQLSFDAFEDPGEANTDIGENTSNGEMKNEEEGKARNENGSFAGSETHDPPSSFHRVTLEPSAGTGKGDTQTTREIRELSDIARSWLSTARGVTIHDLRRGIQFTISEITPEPDADPIEKGIAAFVYTVLIIASLLFIMILITL